MTRKHFEAIAAAMAKQRPIGRLAQEMQWERDCAALSEVLSSINPRFNEETFIKACTQ